MNNSFSYCGIDVSKDHLDTYIYEKVIRFDNTIKGIEKLIKKLGPAHFIMESTGGYERLAAWTLMELGYPVSILNPQRVRNYAKGLGRLAKTDKIDAQTIHDYAQATSPRENRLPTKEFKHLCALMDRRSQLTKLKVSEQNRLRTSYDDFVSEEIKELIKNYQAKIKLIEKEVVKIIKSDEDMNKKAIKLLRITGIGWITAAIILTYVPEVGTLKRGEITALIGVAPYNCDSGNSKGYRAIYGGREKVRTALYMPSITATRYNQHMKEFYWRLVDKNHCKKKVARVAVMRKLIVAANAILKNPDFILAS
jgi:transposase